MLKEINPEKINYLIFKEHIRLIHEETLFPATAWKFARRNVARELGVSSFSLGKQDKWRLFQLIRAEHTRLMEDGLEPRLAWKLSAEYVATQMDVETSEFDTLLRSLSLIWWRHDWEEISTEKNQAELARHEAWHKHRGFFQAVLKIVYEYDPIGIIISGIEGLQSEYATVVNTMLPRLLNANSESEVWKIVYEEFVRWFDSSAKWRCYWFDSIAYDIWEILPQSASPGH